MADVRSEGAATEVVVRLAGHAARPDSAERRALLEHASRIGLSLEALDPTGSDSELGTYLVGRVPADAVDGVIERLVACDGVEAAYAKPSGEPPERSEEDGE